MDQASAIRTYQQVFKCYMEIFKRLGVKAIPMKADSGPIGGDHCHEFHLVAQTGESQIYFDQRFQDDGLAYEEMLQLYAATEEKHDPAMCPIPHDQLLSSRGIEVGHIFYFGTKYSKPMDARVVTHDGTSQEVHMGSYGIGVSRLVAAIIECSHDERGIIWPKEVAPFAVSIIPISNDDQTQAVSVEAYQRLMQARVDVLLDDTTQRPGVKFATHDLIGSTWQLIVTKEKSTQGVVELKSRPTNQAQDMSLEAAIATILGA